MTVNEVIEEIKEIGIRFGASKVILYGSRAKGTNLERSDIDIAVSGVADFGELSEAVEDIETLYSIDLLNLDRCRNQGLLEDVEKYGQKIYEKV